jgi:hypothetical protein
MQYSMQFLQLIHIDFFANVNNLDDDFFDFPQKIWNKISFFHFDW